MKEDPCKIEHQKAYGHENMVRVEEVDPRTSVLIFDDIRTVWVVRDRHNTLIETSHPAEFPEVLAGLRALSLRPEDIDYLAVTHIHIDHAGGAGHLAEANPSLRIFVHEAGLRHLLDPSRLMEGVRAAYGEDFAVVGRMRPVPSPEMLVAVGSGDRIELGETVLEVYETPGHARHHVVFFDRERSCVYAGDALGSFYPDHPNFVLAPPPDYDPGEAKRSIDLVRSLQPRQIRFTHLGPRDLDGTDAFYENLKAKHDLWNERLREIAEEHPDLDHRGFFEMFLERVPEVRDYPDNYFSFNLSVKGILTHLRKSGRLKT
ncbi:MAG: MBL fold metallo-hydrolase [Deltaproteobacteria bacterium]|nr:MBL fold metallo-hydrolase [Deltaproteobacteria bacterium]